MSDKNKNKNKINFISLSLLVNKISYYNDK